MVDLPRAYDSINTSSLLDKIMQTVLPGQVIALIDFMGKNTYVCAFCGEKSSEYWTFKKKVQQGGVSSWVLIIFYLNEVISDASKLPVWCTLNCTKSKH